jgi:diaminohydroxyphosphoribosylaminopyrimidine deaminase / 5-amino-6-(5-phosphoribosylamino)uracil reductase
MSNDRKYMARALALAERGRGRTRPNPLVGCVIVRDGRIIGEGFHARAGEGHAEVLAVSAAGGDIAGATVYVTLEPCAHHGRTPPCAQMLAEKKPARVVAAIQDPNPLVSGKGLVILRNAGIPAECGVMAREAEQLNEVYITYITQSRPLVIAKCAMTLDGKIATRTGQSKWITSPAARRRVHELRNEVDAILVGGRTLQRDDPALTTRLDGRPDTRDPVRIVLDRNGMVTGREKVFTGGSSAPAWVATGLDRDYPFADAVLRVPYNEDGFEMAALMQELGRREITSLLIEGGGAVLASAFAADVVDRVCFFIAPKIIGGRDAITPVEGEGAAEMSEAIALTGMEIERIGPDLLVTAKVERADMHSRAAPACGR